MSAILIALYFLTAPAQELIERRPASPIAAMNGQRYLRWASSGVATVRHGGTTLATLTGPAAIVADYGQDNILRVTIEPNTADNALFYGPEVTQVFVNSHKLNCRVEGANRRAFYPILNNREPCER